MRYKRSALLICAVLFLGGAAMAGGKTFYYDGGYAKKSKVRVFSKGAGLKEAPGFKARDLILLSVTDQVVILEKLNKKGMRLGYLENWYRVSHTNKEGKSLEGYIWGGHLAKYAVHYDLNDDGKMGREYFLLGIIGLNKGTEDQDDKLAQGKLVVDGKTISYVEFSPIETTIGLTYSYSYSVSGRIRKPVNFEPEISLIQIGFSYEAEEYMNGDVMLVCEGDKLFYGFEALKMSVGGGGWSNFEYIFPKEDNGERNSLIVKERTVTAEGREVIENNKYIWEGTEFIKREVR